MNVFVLTEAGQRVGFGHLSRCTAVYHAFCKRGIKPQMIINGDDGITHFLKGIKHEVFNWQESFQELLSKIAGADIVFIDSYLTEQWMYEEIASIVTLVACVDDYQRIRYPAGVVINGLIYAPQMNYPKTTGVQYLLGSKYAILRKAFWSAPVKKVSKQIRRIFITFGGSDFLDLAPETLRMISQQHPKWKKSVVVSRFYPNIERLKGMADKHTRVVIDASDVQMKQMMRQSDVAVSASGQTLSELAVTGVPGVAVCVAENQRRNWKAWGEEGFFCARPQASVIVRALQGMLSWDARSQLSRRLQKSISPSGVMRIADELISRSVQNKKVKKKIIQNRETHVIKLKKVRKSDCRDIWLWRNSWQARLASFQSDPISFESHQDWFNRKSTDRQVTLWIAACGQEKIGHVRFDVDGKKAAISIVLNPQHFGQGFGSGIIEMASTQFLKKNKAVDVIAAEIQDYHQASILAFMSAGYTLRERMVKNGKKAGVYQCQR